MKIETYIDSLVSYAMKTDLAEPCDHQVLTNRLLRILHKAEKKLTDMCRDSWNWQSKNPNGYGE